MAPSRCSSWAVALCVGGCVKGRLKLGGTEGRCGGGGGVAGTRGTTLGDAATVSAVGATLDVGRGGSAEDGRGGGGGGAERKAPGFTEGDTPREDGGGGIRADGAVPVMGRGTTLTGRGTTLAGAGDTPASAGGVGARGSFSSPIRVIEVAGALHRATPLDCNPILPLFAHDFVVHGVVLGRKLKACAVGTGRHRHGVVPFSARAQRKHLGRALTG